MVYFTVFQIHEILTVLLLFLRYNRKLFLRILVLFHYAYKIRGLTQLLSTLCFFTKIQLKLQVIALLTEVYPQPINLFLVIGMMNSLNLSYFITKFFFLSILPSIEALNNHVFSAVLRMKFFKLIFPHIFV